MDEFFANLPPQKGVFCKDCKHSEVSKNNGNLLCLNDRSRYFGAAVSPKKDMIMNCFLYAEKEKRSKLDSNTT